MHSGHADDESEQVIDDGIEKSVKEHSPGQMFDTLEFVVEVDLRHHKNEAKDIHSHSKSADDE